MNQSGQQQDCKASMAFAYAALSACMQIYRTTRITGDTAARTRAPLSTQPHADLPPPLKVARCAQYCDPNTTVIRTPTILWYPWRQIRLLNALGLHLQHGHLGDSRHCLPATRCLAVTGRYDGMPAEEGCHILQSISNDANLFQLRATLSRPVLRPASDSDVEVVRSYREEWQRSTAVDSGDSLSPYPSIMPDHVSQLLTLMIETEGVGILPVEDNVGDVLHCSDFAYVLDLDKDLFEVYSGLTTTDSVLDDRFEEIPRTANLQWPTAALVRGWDLERLPPKKDFVDLTDMLQDSGGSE